MFLLRHGESHFNLHFSRTRTDPGIEDPTLTQRGEQQALRAAETLAPASIRRIIVSPYTRALQTAAIVSRVCGGTIDIVPVVRERFAFACDVGTPRSCLASLWPSHDFGSLAEVWWPRQLEPEGDVLDRARRFQTTMRNDPDQSRTLVVSHWGFLLALTGRSLDNGETLEWEPTNAPPEAIEWL